VGDMKWRLRHRLKREAEERKHARRQRHRGVDRIIKAHVQSINVNDPAFRAFAEWFFAQR
jgi:hypothetical protein